MTWTCQISSWISGVVPGLTGHRHRWPGAVAELAELTLIRSVTDGNHPSACMAVRNNPGRHPPHGSVGPRRRRPGWSVEAPCGGFSFDLAGHPGEPGCEAPARRSSVRRHHQIRRSLKGLPTSRHAGRAGEPGRPARPPANSNRGSPHVRVRSTHRTTFLGAAIEGLEWKRPSQPARTDAK